MTRDEAKIILLLYRTPADAKDPQIAEALALTKSDGELSRWFEEHCSRQQSLRAAFREIPVPAGLKEKILAAQTASRQKVGSWREMDWRVIFRPIPLATMATAAIAGLLFFSAVQSGRRANEWREQHSLANFQNQMAGIAEGGYTMDFVTNDPSQIRSYLLKNGAPSGYTLPPGLEKMAVTGCAIRDWNGAKVSLVCFRTGRPLPPGRQNDLWLFVIERSAVKNFPADGAPQFGSINRLATAFWTKGGEFYFLGTEADGETARQWL